MDFDKDLMARQEARAFARRAKEAQEKLVKLSQEKLDAIVEAISQGFQKEASRLAAMAV